MKNKRYRVLGAMSGTSLDGVDLAMVDFEKRSGQWAFCIVKAQTIPYCDKWRARLTNAIHLKSEDLEKLDVSYTEHLASICKGFLQTNGFAEFDLVCSHGHTVFHRPDLGFTKQIGNRKELADLLRKTVVCDFRVEDVKLGGQGAPLVPVGDQLLFSEFDACLNLGGFGNISFDWKGVRLAFDIVPVNTVLNQIVAEHTKQNFDAEGNWARKGTLCKELLQQLNTVTYYSLKAPKSLGIEFVHTEIVPIMRSYQIGFEDLLRTYVEHIAVQIADSVPKDVVQILVTGGGAYNHFLLERMKHVAEDLAFVVPDTDIVDFKEALIFGLLGVLRMEGEKNVLCSVTGAKYDHCSGTVFRY